MKSYEMTDEERELHIKKLGKEKAYNKLNYKYLEVMKNGK